MRRGICTILLVFLAALAAKAQNDTVVFSANGGFYEDVFQLELYNYYPQNHIRYTTNGNRPTADSPIYSEPLVLDGQLYSKSNIYTIVNCPPDEFYMLDSVQHCIVIRAAVFDENNNCISTVKTNSYFIRSLGCDTHGLPVVALCADTLDLFDYHHGIFVPGSWWYSGMPQWTGNYFGKGRDWERRCNVEFYEQDNRGINQEAGLRTHGGASRRFQQKGLKLYAREEYGKKRFKHSFFEDLPINNVKHFCLKPFRCSNWLQSGLNDALCHRVARALDVDVLATRAVTVFLNGEYWGIYYLEEAPDERYLEDHYGHEPDSCNIIKNWKTLDSGDDAGWHDLYDWVEANDLSDSTNFAYFCSKVDLDNLIDYTIFELYSANVDWPANNTRCWQSGNGKWKWIFYDGDGCFFRDWDVFDNIVDSTDNTNSNTNATSTLFYRRLLKNQSFCDEFRARCAEILHSHLNYEHTAPILVSLRKTIEDELPNECHRFHFPASVSVWQADVDKIDAYLRMRNAIFEAQMMAFMDVFEQEIPVALACYPNPSHDEIHLMIESDVAKKSELMLLDITGRCVYRQSVQLYPGLCQFTLCPDLSAGLYVLRVENHALKVVVQ